MKLFDIFRRNNLDEMQEQKLLHIEKNAFWLLYFMLAAGILVKIALGCEKKSLLGDFFCLAVASVYILYMCVKNGIWDRHLKANTGTNFAASLLAGMVVAVFNTILVFNRMSRQVPWAGLVATFLISGLLTFMLTFFVMSILTFLYRKRAEKLEDEQEDEPNDRSN